MILTLENIIINQEFNSQDQIFKYLSNLAYELNVATTKKAYYKALVKREKQSSTGFEKGFAIPHGIDKNIVKPTLFFVRVKQGIDWKALDNLPTKYIFALAIPAQKVASIHIDILSKIAVAIMQEDFQEAIKNAESAIDILKQIEAKILDKEQKSE